MSVKPLNHYSLTNPASVYDEESMTALELAGRTAAKVNEAVEAFNKLENDTNERLTKQEETQIPEAVDAEVKSYVDDGKFDAAIEDHIGNLETRVDNLLSGYTPGSTTADAELIDIRTGAKSGETYPNAGEAVRAKANRDEINRFFDNDIFTGQATNLYPYGDHAFNYPALANPLPPVGKDFLITSGDFMLVVTGTNAKRLIVSYAVNNSSEFIRVMDITDPTTGVYYFTIPTTTHGEIDNIWLRISYGSTTSSPVEGDYYFKHAYIFPADSVKIPREFVNRDLTIFDTAEVINQKGKNLYTGGEIAPVYYDGSTPSSEFAIVKPIYLKPESTNKRYLIKISNPTRRVIISLNDETPTRLMDVMNVSGNKFYAFSVPAETSEIILSAYPFYGLPGSVGWYSISGITILPNDGKPFLPDYLTRFDEVEDRFAAVDDRFEKIENSAGSGTGFDSSIAGKFLRAGSSTPVTRIEIPDEVHVKKNYSIAFTCKLMGNAARLTIGHGKTSYQSTYAVLDGGGIEVYTKYDGTPSSVYSSTFAVNNESGSYGEFIDIDINVKGDVATMSIVCANGQICKKDIPWVGCNGKVFAELDVGSFESCELRWTSPDLDKKVWVFGDSYFSDDLKRIYGQLKNRGYTNFLCTGYPGANSAAELTTLENLLKLNTPDVVIWCMGMNDGDGASVNNSWLTCFNRVRTLCAERGIELIAATIPNTPVVINTGKNTVVRSSGLRYVEFSAAVNTSATEWYAGTLDTDNVHPTARGAMALTARLLVDAPEIMR